MFGAFDVSASALTAQRVRLETIASNIANIDSVLGPNGKPAPYRRLYPVFQPQRTSSGGVGVGVSSIEQDGSAFKEFFEPWNTRAKDDRGYVKYPNVDLATEQVNALETTRAYEANVTAIETTKSMISATLRVLA
jgi:flagellar basal-body rod protein FlgC